MSTLMADDAAGHLRKEEVEIKVLQDRGLLLGPPLTIPCTAVIATISQHILYHMQLLEYEDPIPIAFNQHGYDDADILYSIQQLSETTELIEAPEEAMKLGMQLAYFIRDAQARRLGIDTTSEYVDIFDPTIPDTPSEVDNAICHMIRKHAAYVAQTTAWDPSPIISFLGTMPQEGELLPNSCELLTELQHNYDADHRPPPELVNHTLSFGGVASTPFCSTPVKDKQFSADTLKNGEKPKTPVLKAMKATVAAKRKKPAVKFVRHHRIPKPTPSRMISKQVAQRRRLRVAN